MSGDDIIYPKGMQPLSFGHAAILCAPDQRMRRSQAEAVHYEFNRRVSVALQSCDISSMRPLDVLQAVADGMFADGLTAKLIAVTIDEFGIVTYRPVERESPL